jgi:hypothetical protein
MNAFDVLAMALWFASSCVLIVENVQQRRRIRNLERALKDSLNAWEESAVSCEYKGYWVLRGERIEAWTHALNHK